MPKNNNPQVPMEEKRRPVWSNEQQILISLDQIARFIDAAAIDSESGNIGSYINWRAGLKQFYRRIQNLFRPDIRQLADDCFKQLDPLMDPITRTITEEPAELKKAHDILEMLTEMFYQAYNDLFIKFNYQRDQKQELMEEMAPEAAARPPKKTPVKPEGESADGNPQEY